MVIVRRVFIKIQGRVLLHCYDFVINRSMYYYFRLLYIARIRYPCEIWVNVILTSTITRVIVCRPTKKLKYGHFQMVMNLHNNKVQKNGNSADKTKMPT